MKLVYNSLSMKTGTLNPGLYQVQFAPREWLAADPIIDFSTGTVTQPVAFVPGRTWLSVEFTPESHDYDDKPKTNRAGPYREITFNGLLNELDTATLQVLATIENHQLVVVLHDRQKRRRLVGTRQAGMVPSWGHTIKNSSSGTETLPITFALEQEVSPPYYTG